MREFTLRHNAQRHLGQSEDWILWVSLVTRIFNVWRNELSRHFVGHWTSFQAVCWYVNFRTVTVYCPRTVTDGDVFTFVFVSPQLRQLVCCKEIAEHMFELLVVCLSTTLYYVLTNCELNINMSFRKFIKAYMNDGLGSDISLLLILIWTQQILAYGCTS